MDKIPYELLKLFNAALNTVQNKKNSIKWAFAYFTMKKTWFYFLTSLIFLFFSCASLKEGRTKDEYITTESGALIAKTLKFEGTYKNEKYIFLRLYSVVYDQNHQIGNLLRIAIGALGPATDGLYYSHAAISYKLSDNFVGITIGGENNVKYESVMEPEKNRYLASNNKYKSQCTVIAIPCTKIDYENCKDLIDYAVMSDSRFYFGITDLIAICGIRAVNKYKTKNFSCDTIDFNESEPILSPQEEFNSRIYCCSAFCAYILMRGIQRYKDYVEATGFSPRGVTPADLYSIQGSQHLFNCYYFEYNQTLAEFVEAYPEFKEYL